MSKRKSVNPAAAEETLQVAENLLVGEPERTPDGRLTYKGMRQVLARGGTVVHQGRHIANAQELPDQIRLEGTSPEALDSIEEDLEKQQEDLDKRRRRLEKQRKRIGAAEADAESEADAETSDETGEETPDLESLKKSELLKLAQERDVEVDDSMTKPEIIEAIEAKE